MSNAPPRALQRLRELEAQLAIIRTAIDSAAQNGQSFSIAGSFSQTNIPISDLRTRESSLQKQINIIRYGGTAQRTLPDFS